MTSQLKNCQKSEKSSKSLKSLKGLKNLQKPLVWRNVYQSTNSSSIRYEEFELPLEFWQFFKFFLLKSRSFFNTKFGAIVVKAKLMKLLMLCYVFSAKEPVSFKPLCTKKTRGLYSQYLYIVGRTPATTQFLLLFDRLMLEGFIDGFHDGISTERASVTIWPLSLLVYTISECRMHLEVFIPTDSIISIWDLIYTSKFYSSYPSA